MVELFAGLRDKFAPLKVETIGQERPELAVRNMPASVAATITPGALGSGEMLLTAPGMFASKGAQEAPEVVVWNNETEFPERPPSIGATVGNWAESVYPVTYAFPLPSIARPCTLSWRLPPRYVTYANAEPALLSLATNPSVPPPETVCSAPAVVGRSVEYVDPPTYAFPPASTAIA